MEETMIRQWGIALLLVIGLVLLLAGLALGEAARAQTEPGQTPEGQITEPAPEEVVPNSGFYLPAEPEADAENVELVGHIGGTRYAVAVQGNYAFVGEGPRLTILNISNPAKPVVIGKSLPLPEIEVIQDIAVAGNYAYIAGGRGGLRIINIANPAAPVEVGFYDSPEYNDYVAVAVAVSGNYAYVVTAYNGLRIIDVANPANPTEVGFYGTWEYINDVAVAGNYAYIANGLDGLRIISIANPATPTEVGFYGHLGNAIAVAVSGNYAYVANGDGLWTINITNPATLVEPTFYESNTGAGAVTVVGNYAYVAGYGELQIIDVSNPDEPSQVGSYVTSGLARDVAVATSYTFVLDANGTLSIINVANPAAPVEVGLYSAPDGAFSVTVSGNSAYVTDAGLRIIDVANPAAPVEVGFYSALDGAISVTVSGNYAYVPEGQSGLRIINVTNPVAPTEVGFYDTPEAYAQDVVVASNYAYVVDGWVGGLRIINVANPAAPTEVGFYDTPGLYAQDVAVAGNYAYVANGDGLRIINIVNPAAPTEIGFYDTLGFAYGVSVADNFAYVLDSGWLRIIDVANPAAPTEAGFFLYDTEPQGRAVAVAGNYAYIADSTDGLRIINVANPAAPTEVGFYDTPGVALGVAVIGNYAYVADGWGGLLILRFNGGNQQTYTISGKVTMQNGTPLQGVVVSAGFGVHATTNAKGEYTINDLAAGTYDVGGTLDGYTFPLISAVVPPDKVNLNLVAQLKQHSFDLLFRSQPHGYYFENGSWQFAPGDFTFQDYQQMLGDEIVCLVPNPGGGYPCLINHPSAKKNFGDAVKYLEANGGDCNGMAVTSLLYFENPSNPPTNTYNRQLPAARRAITYYQVMQHFPPISSDVKASRKSNTPNDVLNQIQNALKNGDLLILNLYQFIGGEWKGHAVVPYALQDLGNGVWDVIVYDNNLPSPTPNLTERSVRINTQNNTWSYPWGHTQWNGNEFDGSIITTQLNLYQEKLERPWLLGAEERIIGDPRSGEQSQIWLSGNGNLLITDSNGRKLGISGLEFVQQIPGSDYFLPVGGLDVPIKPVYFLPATEAYTITLDGTSAGQSTRANESASITQFGPGYGVSVENIPVTTSTHDLLTIAQDGTAVVYQATNNGQPDIALMFDGVTSSQQFEILGADVENGQTIEFEADPQTQQLVFNSADAGGGAYDLRIVLADTSAERPFQYNNIAMGAGDTHYIDYSRWAGGTGAVVVAVDEGSDGTIDEEIELGRPSGGNVYLPLIVKPFTASSQ